MRRESLGPSRLAARTLDKGERGYFDIAGPMPVDSAEFGYKYALMFVLERSGHMILGGSRYKTTDDVEHHLRQMQATLRPYSLVHCRSYDLIMRRRHARMRCSAS